MLIARRSIGTIACLFLAFAACGDGSEDRGGGFDSAGGADDGGDGGDGGGDGDGGDGADDGGDEGDDGGDGTGDDGADDGGDGSIPAAGIRIDEVTINQGVEIPIVQGGVFLEESERVAPVIGNRPALVRAFWSLEDGFEPRELEAHLVFTYEDGTTKVMNDTRMVSGPPNPNSYNGGFTWGVLAEEFAGDAEIHVAIFETDGESNGEPSGYRVPEEGEEQLRGVTRRMLLDVVVVPTCNHAPLADWEQEIFTAYLYNTYPVNEINITFHDPIANACDEYEAAYEVMPDLRWTEEAPPWRFYGGLVQGSCGGVAPFGGGPWATQKDAQRTFGLCDWRYTFPTVDLFAHEMGHVHGRDHTFEDPSYPYETCGGRDTVGFGLMPADMPSSSWGDESAPMQQIIPPSYAGCTAASWNDFMSYAYPYWVSDYTYLHIAEVIWQLSAWADEGASGPAPGPGVTLRGVVTPEGKVHVGATRGVGEHRSLEPSGVKARFFAGEVLVGEHDVEISETHHDPGPDDQWQPTRVRTFTIRLPGGIEGDRFEIDLDGETNSFSTGRWR
jgi:hypothetical protein